MNKITYTITDHEDGDSIECDLLRDEVREFMKEMGFKYDSDASGIRLVFGFGDNDCYNCQMAINSVKRIAKDHPETRLGSICVEYCEFPFADRLSTFDTPF
jgi:hypothetical protein